MFHFSSKDGIMAEFSLHQARSKAAETDPICEKELMIILPLVFILFSRGTIQTGICLMQLSVSIIKSVLSERIDCITFVTHCKK